MTGTRRAAPAKLNLTLEVIGRRPDGYHDLRTVMQTLELADTVTVGFGGGRGIDVHGPCSRGVPVDHTNLAWRAADELAHRTGHATSDLHLSIDKRIPAAAGLGGGASDAAAVLRLLADAWQVRDEPLLNACAAAVGSDEPFFLRGGTALVTGRGESVEPLQALPPHDVVLFVPRDTIEAKTARLFRELGATPFDSGKLTERFLAAHPAQVGPGDLHNAFERVAFDVFPGLAGMRDEIVRAIGSQVRLAGAGPALFWIGPLGEGGAVARRAGGVEGLDVIRTRTAP